MISPGGSAASIKNSHSWHDFIRTMLNGLMLSCVVFVFLVIWRSGNTLTQITTNAVVSQEKEHATGESSLDWWTNAFIYGTVGLLGAIVIFELFSSGRVPSVVESAKNAWKIEPDGNCLFRALAHHQKGDQSKWLEVKKELLSHLESGMSGVSVMAGAMGDEGEKLIHRSKSTLSSDGAWGGETEIALAADLYNARITVVGPNGRQIGTDYNENGEHHWFLYWVSGGDGNTGVHYEAEQVE